MPKKKNWYDPKLVERFKRENRSQGIGIDYSAWHQVKRGELSSHGLSSIIPSDTGAKQILSTVEKVAYLCSVLLPYYLETREQFSLFEDKGPNEIWEYTGQYGSFIDGTQQIAQKLGIPHRKTPGPYTTDQLITFKRANAYKLLAVACKDGGTLTARQLELLLVEKVYWNIRGVNWILFTPNLYTRVFANTLLTYAPMVLNPSNPVDLNLVNQIVTRLNTHQSSYTDLFKYFSDLGYGFDLFSKAFWHGYFSGDIPMEININFNSQLNIKLTDRNWFMNQNPLFNGRSAWN